MSAEREMIKLYSGRILALAADIPLQGRLDAPKASVTRRAPLCGSTVTVDLDLDAEGRISRFSQEVRACALGQAAAAVLGAHVLGCNRGQIATAVEELRAMLKTDAHAPAAPFEDLEVLIPAREYRNRHGSILLALEATLEAVDAASKANCA